MPSLALHLRSDDMGREPARSRAPSRGTVAVSWVWAGLPLVSLGFATAPAMIYAAVHTRHKVQALLAVVYAALTVLAMMSAGAADESALDNVFEACLTVLWLLGTGHALAIRKWVFDQRTGSRTRTLRERQAAALEAHREQEAVRERAKRIVAEDPQLAAELEIGRVDKRARKFPDGGLVDVNNVDAEALAKATALPGETVDKIVEMRDQVGGFDSAADVAVTLDLPPTLLDAVEDRLVFLPPRAG